MNNDNDLYELKNYMKNNFNLKVNIRIPNGNVNKITINDIYLNLIFNVIILILSIFFLIKIKKKYNKVFIILIVLILLYFLYKIFHYLYSIYLYNNIYINDNYNSISYKNIDFSTGDIIQETLAWYDIKGILYHMFNNKHKYMHGGIIINFKNKNYILHLVGRYYVYSNFILEFDEHNKIEICPLDNYMKDNYFHSKYYRLFKVNDKSKINNEKLFNVLKEIDIKKITFDYNLHVPENNNYDNNFSKKYNCLNFIFKILYKLNIVPLFNFQNILSNDFIFLPNLSNNIYNKEIYFTSNI